MAIVNFDATNVPQMETIEAVPAGWYNVAMDQSEMKPAKAEGNFFLECRFNILDGQYAGRKLFSRINLKNSNPVAQEIAYKEMSSICHAVGLIQCQDSEHLHGRPLKVKVKVKPATGEYEASNDITSYKNINENVGQVPAAAAPAGFAAPAQQAPQGGQPQWAAPQAPAPQQQQQQAPAPQAQQAPQQTWQPPAAQQPWAQTQVQQPAPQQQVQQAPVQQQAPAGAPGAAPAWMAQAGAPAGGAPAWAQQPLQQ